MQETLEGPAREPLDRTEIDRLRSSVIIDERRRRPLYFDGRFLAARDLVREQSYFLTRQADLGRAGGTGVVRGLMVERGTTSGTLRIGAGHGLTAAGEPVMLPGDLVVRLDDLPQIQRLDLTLGLLEIPREPVRNRTGVYIIALRPVEFTANPIASYPTSIDGQRSVEDGDIIEGTVVTLIPYPDAGTGTADDRRARAAYDTFVRGAAKGRPAPVLPLALVSLNLNTVEWVDPFLVRRDVGAEHGDALGIGVAPRALREAHVLQYDFHLRDVLKARGAAGQRFAAADYFRALPPAGRMPAAAIGSDFTQVWFPSTVDADLAIVPADELPAILEESFHLPPIDLTRTAEELDSVSVMVLVPVPRSTFAATANALGTVTRPLPPATPWMLARRQPVDVLRGLRLPTLFAPQSTPTNDGSWNSVLSGVPMLWYVRRRNLATRVDVTGTAVSLDQLRERLDAAAGAQEKADLAPPDEVPPAKRDTEMRLSPGFELPTDDAGAADAVSSVEESGGKEAGGREGGGKELAPVDPAVAGLRVAGKITLDPAVTTLLRDALLAAPASSPGGSSDEVVLSPAVAALLHDAVVASGKVASVEGAKAAALETRPAGEVTLAPALAASLRDAVAAGASAGSVEDESAASAGEATLTARVGTALFHAVAAATDGATVDVTTSPAAAVALAAAPAAEKVPEKAPSGDAAPATLAEAVIAAVRKDEAAGKDVPVSSEALLADARFGAGLEKLEKAQPGIAQDGRAVANLARSGAVQDLDRIARAARGAKADALAGEVAGLAASRAKSAPGKLADAIRSRLPGGGK